MPPAGPETAFPSSRSRGVLFAGAQLALQLGRRDEAAALLRRAAAATTPHEDVHLLLSQLELPGRSYRAILAKINEHLLPSTYLEIGVARGRTLRLVGPETDAIGVDPEPRLPEPPVGRKRVFAETSDDFFAHRDVVAEFGGRRVDLAFIDGLHRFDFALRDFMNVERVASPGGVIAIHDCLPLDARTAAAERTTRFWSGDVWRLVVALRRHRPDLEVRTVAAWPTGLALVTNLDPASAVLGEAYPGIVAELSRLEFREIERDKARALGVIPGDWAQVRAFLDARSGA